MECKCKQGSDNRKRNIEADIKKRNKRKKDVLRRMALEDCTSKVVTGGDIRKMDSKIFTVIESKNGSIPENLEKVIRNIEEHDGSASTNQIISAVFYTLMLESGFVLDKSIDNRDINANGDSEKSSTSIPESDEKFLMTFNHKRLMSQTDVLTPYVLNTCPNGLYKIPFRLIGISDYALHLIIIPSGEDLIVVNLLVVKDDLSECFAIALRTSSFVPRPESPVISQRFFDLRTLSIVFKDNIAHKGRSFILNSEGVANNSFEGLLEEIKLKIMQDLPIRDFLNLASTCSRIHSEAWQETVWRTLLRRDFGYIVNITEGDDQSIDQLVSMYKEFRVGGPVRPAV